jgi:hypothetical protein
MSFPGAPAALRGFRLQHLYTLHRLLADDSISGFDIQLEGSEDLEIFDPSGRPVEAVQVKSRRGDPLSPSDLASAADSFFERARRRLRDEPAMVQRVACFGPVGRTVQAMSAARGANLDGDARASLERFKFSRKQIDAFRSVFLVDADLDDAAMERDVHAWLRETVAGALNPDAAFLYLSGWMQRASEERRRITAGDVRELLTSAGRFVAEAAAHGSEWFTTIVPLREIAIPDEDRERLASEFHRGISTRLEHVAAGADVIRDEQLDAIDEAFAQMNVVVVHGASGEGKTALAWRYLIDRMPSAWRFEVRALQDVTHALRVALALGAHARAVGVPMLVWLDVAPRDPAWRNVVEELRVIRGMRVLVTIREEDWTRARNSGAMLMAAGVALALHEAEAERIFDGLRRRAMPANVLDFRDAWQRFGARGPLLEFTYLLTQHEALEAKLDGQVRGIRDEVREGKLLPSELELLRRASVVTAFGGRLDLRHAAAELQLPDVTQTSGRFEREYLLRVTNDGAFVEALHPIRSAIVARLLTGHDVLATWASTASASLPSIAEEDLETFLLRAFVSRAESEVAEVVAALGELRPQSLSGAAGVLRALLWLGVKRYTIEHADLIAEVRQRMPDSELIWAVLDPAGLTRYAPSLLGFEEALKMLPDLYAWYMEIKSRRPANEQVFEAARLWLAAQPRAWTPPRTDAGWSAAAEVLFWTAAWSVPIDREQLASAAAGAGLPVAVLADVIFAASFVDDGAFERVRSEAVARFQRETSTVTIDVTAGGVMAHWLLPLEEDLDVERETVRRLDVLRRLFPKEQAFGGHVHGSVSGEVKRGISADQFPVPWVLRVHLMFARLVALDRRGETWGEYVAAIVSLRERIVQLAARITHALTLYFRRDKPTNIFESGVDAEEWDALTAALGSLPKLPRSAVDEWGFETEGAARAWSAGTANAHAPYTKALGDYASAVRDFLQSSWRVFVAHPQIGRGTPAGREKVAAWSEAEQINPAAPTLHLAEAVKRIEKLQPEFRARFSLHAPALPSLEPRETETLWSLWAVWYDFAFHPRRRLANAARDSVAAIAARLDDRRRALRRRLRAMTLSKTGILVARRRGEAGAGIWLTVDVQRVPDTINGFAETLVHVIDVLRPPADANAFDRYALDLAWEHVHLVPLVRGRSIDRRAWKLVIADLPQPDEDLSAHAWKFVPQPVSGEVWQSLELPTWPATVGSSARRLAASAAAWRDAMRHVLNLRGVPLRDDLGKDVLSSHWRAGLATADRAAAEVAAGLSALPSEIAAPQPELRETLQAVVASLRETLASARELDFGAIEEVVATIGNTIVPAVTVVADLWLDRELA